MGKVKWLRLGMSFASIVAFKLYKKIGEREVFICLLEEMRSAVCGKRCVYDWSVGKW